MGEGDQKLGLLPAPNRHPHWGISWSLQRGPVSSVCFSHVHSTLTHPVFLVQTVVHLDWQIHESLVATLSPSLWHPWCSEVATTYPSWLPDIFSSWPTWLPHLDYSLLPGASWDRLGPLPIEVRPLKITKQDRTGHAGDTAQW